MAKDEIKTDPVAPAAAPDTPAAAAPLVMTQEQLNQIIAAATAATKAEVMGDMVKLFAAQKAEGTGDTSALISDLAMAIAGMTDTGNGRRVIPPVEAKRREDAAARMGDILNRISKDTSLRPHYEVVSHTWLDNQLIEPWISNGADKFKRNEIIWRAAPNSALRPVNAIAKELFNAYLESIGGTTRNLSGVREHPSWAGNEGSLQMVGVATTTAASHGLVREPAEPATLGVDLPSSVELTSTDDPNASRIQVLGKTFAPAERTAPGNVPKLAFPHSN
jgi:hypothetical protein